MGAIKDLHSDIVESLDEGMTPLEVARKLNIPVETVLLVLEEEITL